MYNSGQKIEHQDYGTGVILEAAELFYKIDFGKLGVRDISRRPDLTNLLKTIPLSIYRPPN
jgi:hypothetical protein